MAKPGNTGVKRILNATRYSYQGLCAAFKHEAAFRQELFLVFLLIPVGLWLGNNRVEQALLLASLVLVLIVELLNSGLEAIVDRVGSGSHELSGRAKDIGSAAVFVSLVNALVVWLLIIFGSVD